jgi:CRISPR/Cas system CSM-associated protein Csm3 (group 7 of RAMP superfamily)
MKNLYLILAVLTLLSCSSERKAQYHYNKALKHGLKVIQDSDTIRITTLDSFPVIKNDTIVYEKFFTTKDTVVNFRNVYLPKTRFQTRIEYKERVKIERIQGKTITKNHEVVKYRINWWLILIAFSLGFLLRFILVNFLFPRIKINS